MGWGSGSILLSEIINDLHAEVRFSDEDRKQIYLILIDNFEDRDCDTTYECVGDDPAFDHAFYELHPDWYDEDWEEEDDE